VRKTNFLLVGAAKCSLFEYLRRHPDVYMPEGKEISFFAGRNNPGTIEDYYRFFAGAKNQKRVGEASGGYLYSAAAVAKIADCLGQDIKIIILLRHPVMMAYSLWGQNIRDTGETLSFEEALEMESTRLQDDTFKQQLGGWWIYNYAYKDRARFAPQVKRYLETFGHENVRVYIYELFFQDVERSLVDVYEFLDIDTSFRLPHYARFNQASTVKSKLLHRLYSERMFWTEPLRAILPASLRRAIMMRLYKLNSKTRSLPPLPPLLKNRLLEYFVEDIRELERLLNISLKEVWN
jgi:hypothetical protein